MLLFVHAIPIMHEHVMYDKYVFAWGFIYYPYNFIIETYESFPNSGVTPMENTIGAIL
jgi:hypothetical protein